MWYAVVLSLRLLLLFLVAHTHNSDGCTLINLLCLARIVNKKRQCTSTRSQSFSINEIIVYKKISVSVGWWARQVAARTGQSCLMRHWQQTARSHPPAILHPRPLHFLAQIYWGSLGIFCVPMGLPWNAWLISDQKHKKMKIIIMGNKYGTLAKAHNDNTPLFLFYLPSC